jgi:hypothetical protein|tara:strand:- start:11711 stop:12040 length:330 start_codon:yes stop_codon:yes gene_type:complete
MAKEKIKKVIKGLKKASKTHAKQAKTLESIAKFGKGGGATTKKDACYRKVKSRYKVWPSAYASGALVKCRKVGAKNWGNKTKKMSNGGHVVSRGLTKLLPGKRRRTKLG